MINIISTIIFQGVCETIHHTKVGQRESKSHSEEEDFRHIVGFKPLTFGLRDKLVAARPSLSSKNEERFTNFHVSHEARMNSKDCSFHL